MMLIQLAPGVHYRHGGVNFGMLEAPGKRLVLIDAGLDAGAPRKALRDYLTEGYSLAAVVATHCHADHVGGCAELVRRYGCEVYAPAPEHVILEHPGIATMCLYGAYAPPGLQVKFLQPPPARLTGIIPPGRFEVAGLELEAIPLPGHSPGQVGIRCGEVLFAADGLFVPDVLARHAFLFLVRADEFLASLDTLSMRPEPLLVPGHGLHLDRRTGPDPLPGALAANRAHVAEVQAALLGALCAGPAGEETLLAGLAAARGKVYDNAPSWYLDRAAVSAHLSALAAAGRVRADFTAGVHRWALAAEEGGPGA